MRRKLKLDSDKPVSELLANAAELSDVRIAMQQIEAGQAVSNSDAKAELRRRFGK